MGVATQRATRLTLKDMSLSAHRLDVLQAANERSKGELGVSITSINVLTFGWCGCSAAFPRSIFSNHLKLNQDLLDLFRHVNENSFVLLRIFNITNQACRTNQYQAAPGLCVVR